MVYEEDLLKVQINWTLIWLGRLSWCVFHQFIVHQRFFTGINYGIWYQDAFEKISHQMQIEDILMLNQYWAGLEIDVAKDLPAAREIWENCLKNKLSFPCIFILSCWNSYFVLIPSTHKCVCSPSGSILEVWKHYINMEVMNGNKNAARSLYKRCCEGIAGSALKVSSSWASRLLHVCFTSFTR